MALGFACGASCEYPTEGQQKGPSFQGRFWAAQVVCGSFLMALEGV